MLAFLTGNEFQNTTTTTRVVTKPVLQFVQGRFISDLSWTN